MAKNKSKKRNTGGRVIVFLILLLMLAALLLWKIYINGGLNLLQNEPAPAVDTSVEKSTSVSTPEPALPTPEEEAATSVPAATTPAPVQEPTQAPVIMESQGDLEIIIPDDMGTDGF